MLVNQLARDRSSDRITLKVDDRHVLIDAATIDCIEVSDKVVIVQTAEQTYRVREPLNRIEQRLPSEQFVRIHRSVIVNIKRVKEIQPWFQGDYVLILKNGKRLMSGRAYRDVVRRFTARSDSSAALREAFRLRPAVRDVVVHRGGGLHLFADLAHALLELTNSYADRAADLRYTLAPENHEADQQQHHQFLWAQLEHDNLHCRWSCIVGAVASRREGRDAVFVVS
jgi:hypothetical protein